MIERLANSITDFLIREQGVSEKMKEWYVYTFVRMLENIISIGSLLILGIILGKFIQTVLFLIFFVSLRQRTGGFHFEQYWHCYVGSMLIYLAVVVIESVMISNTKIWYVILVIAIIIVFAMGTVNHPNINFSHEELRASRRLARYILTIEVIIIGAFMGVKLPNTYIWYMSAGVILCAILLALARVGKQELLLDEGRTGKNDG